MWATSAMSEHPAPRGGAAGPVIESLVIESMSHGSDAVARHEGKVVFVAGGAPGDVADVVVTDAGARLARATVRALREASGVRREPACPHFGRCGGCQWQHLAYAAQLEAKQRNLAEALRRIGGFAEAPVQPALASPAEWRYRHRINLRVDGRQLGFYRAESHALVEIDACPIAAEPLERALGAARRWLAATTTTVRRLALVAAEQRPGVVLVANAEGPFAVADDPVTRGFLADAVRAGVAAASVRGVVVFGKRWRRTWGDVQIDFEVDPAPGRLGLETTAGEFTQVNLAANRLLVETSSTCTAAQAISRSPSPGGRAASSASSAGRVPSRTRRPTRVVSASPTAASGAWPPRRPYGSSPTTARRYAR
jgi:23S rRNA (uracil1939-C5)-methyltransferase